MLLDRSNDFLILFMTFWKLIRSCTVTPRWLGNAKECIQSGWSKQRDSCSLANEISATDAGCFDSCISRNYLAVSTWILNGSSIECHEKKHQPFSLSCVRFGSRAIQISGWKSAWHWRSRKSLSEPSIHFPNWVAHSHWFFELQNRSDDLLNV